MPMMCEECKCSNWYCAECGESSHHDCDCSCCGCKCQTPEDEVWCDDCGKSRPFPSEECECKTQPTNQIGEPTMTMINPEPIKLTPSQTQVQFTIDEVERIKADRDAFKESKDAYVEKFHKAQSTINMLVTAINNDIRELGLTTDDSFPLDTLSDIFDGLGLELDFNRLFKVEMEYTIRAVLEVEAASEEEAVADVQANVSLYDINIDGTVIDWDVRDESFINAEEA